MNLFKNFSFTALFYFLLFYSSVFCRISDKKKCSNADCSEPISLATTLIRYNADDDRLLSFPRNVRLKVYSKEAGDTPNFWEVEIYGKRGFVPKGLLREDKVLIPPSKLTHIVPTGRIDTPIENTTNDNLEDQEPKSLNLITATPELPVANSKGLFSTIGVVSADSVPMNSPDIKPQSTRKFEVFEGTTLYDDVVSEKPESPPTIIGENANENQEINKKPPLDSKKVSYGSNVPSDDIKPVNEEINETEQSSEKEVDKQIEEEIISSKEEKSDSGKETENSDLESPSDGENQVEEGAPEPPSDKGNQFEEGVPEPSSVIGNQVEEGVSEPTGDDRLNQAEEDAPESLGETNILGKLYSQVTNMLSSGAGEDITEEEGDEDEDEEGSAEEEDEENDKESSRTEGPFEGSSEKESEVKPQPDGQLLGSSQMNTSEAPNLINILDDQASDLKLDDTLNSEKHDISNQETVEDKVLPEKTTIDEESSRAAEESKKGSSEIKSQESKDIKQNFQQSTSEEPVNESIAEIDKRKTDFTQGSGLLEKEKIKLTETGTSTSNSGNFFELPSQQSKTETIDQVLVDEKITDGKFLEKETAEPTDNQFDKASASEGKTDSIELQVQDQPKIEEHPEKEQSKIEELHVEQPKTDEPLVQEQPEISTGPPVEPTTHQFLFGSRQINEVGPEKNGHETSKTTSQPEHDTKPQFEPLNETAQISNIPSHDTTYSSLPKLQPVGSPKYTSIISRRIRSSESADNEILSHSEEEEDSEPQADYINDLSESTQIHEEIRSPDFLHQSRSPKYGSVISQRIGSVAPTDDTKSEAIPEAAFEMKTEHPESDDGYNAEEKLADMSSDEKISQAEVKPTKEIELEEEMIVENKVVNPQESQLPTPSDDVPPADLDHDLPAEVSPEEGMLSWVNSLFGNKDSGNVEELSANSENFDSSRLSHFAEETCSADGIEGSCHTMGDTMQKEVTWQESSYTSDMWELLDKVPLEATIWLVITAVVVLIFSLGHYYIEAHRRDGPLVAIINKLEREVLILKKESCILEDRMQIAQQQLEAWNTSSTENDALLVELKQELEETKIAKAELEEQAAQLKEELETVTESGLEMHRLLEESLSSQDGSQVLLSTVETLREKLQRQEEEISGLSDTLSSKNAEVEELYGKLAQSAEVARSLEDKVISVTRGKEEELLQLRDKHRELISQLEEVMETKALDETRLSTEMSKLRLTIEELQKTLAEKDSELDTLKEVVKQLRATDSNEKIEALFDVVGVRSKLKTAVAERDDFREKFLEEEGARKLLEGHMKKITQEVADLKNSFETAEKEKIEALTKLQVLSNYFKEKESQLQKELGLQESMWLQKQSDDHSIYEQMRSLREENEKYKLQNESLKKEIVEQEASFKIQLANTEQKAHENWVASRQAERRLKEAQQESAQLRNRLTTVEKNTANYSLDEKPNISESNGDPSSPPPSLMFPPTTSPPFMMYGPPIPPPGDFVPPPPFMGSPYPSDSRPPPLGRISSPPLDHRFSPPPPLSYPPYDYTAYGHHSPSPPPPLPSHHRNVHKPQPREMSREQKDHVPNYSPEAEKTSRRNKR